MGPGKKVSAPGPPSNPRAQGEAERRQGLSSLPRPHLPFPGPIDFLWSPGVS